MRSWSKSSRMIKKLTFGTVFFFFKTCKTQIEIPGNGAPFFAIEHMGFIEGW